MLCDCGHEDFSHEDDDGVCNVGGCDCDGFTGGLDEDGEDEDEDAD